MTDNDIDNSGAYNLSEALKTNTTLTELDLSCEDKWTHKRHPPASHSSLSSHTDNIFRDLGATSLSEALESNTTLTKLDLNSEKTRYQEWKYSFL